LKRKNLSAFISGLNRILQQPQVMTLYDSCVDRHRKKLQNDEVVEDKLFGAHGFHVTR
jgi:hypothetical protein